MDINKSSYYKWLKTKDIKNQHELDREFFSSQIISIHGKHPSYGYHAIAAVIRKSTGLVFSDNIIHKCCKAIGIRSQIKHYRYTPKRKNEEHKIYPNIIRNNWDTDKPLEIIVTDMTCINYRKQLYDVVLYMDAFNNEIISYAYTEHHNAAQPYYDGLEIVLSKLKGIRHPTVLHSDQGSTYSSLVFNDTYKNYNIKRSMSRAGTPTDNPKMESINGWIKAEIESDWDIDSYPTFKKFINTYIYYYNNQRPAYALHYKTPVQYKVEQGF